MELEIGQTRQNLPNFYGELVRPRLKEDLRYALDGEVDACGERRQGTHVQHTQTATGAGNAGGPRDRAHFGQEKVTHSLILHRHQDQASVTHELNGIQFLLAKHLTCLGNSIWSAGVGV